MGSAGRSRRNRSSARRVLQVTCTRKVPRNGLTRTAPSSAERTRRVRYREILRQAPRAGIPPARSLSRPSTFGYCNTGQVLLPQLFQKPHSRRDLRSITATASRAAYIPRGPLGRYLFGCRKDCNGPPAEDPRIDNRRIDPAHRRYDYRVIVIFLIHVYYCSFWRRLNHAFVIFVFYLIE
ncbi:hypothetical protein PUN28_003752 [Cardiocondyla obscurior]|uniref:Uncharacterized protein n=1 Tax=Cardiocondyla obscurior TaxID=286306 RepID=A0AAW2GMN2_9HYME